MSTFARTDTSLLGRWWWTVDRWLLAAVLVLMAAGALLILAASPAVAEHIGLGAFHFVKRQFVYLVPAFTLLIGFSLLPPLTVRRAGTLLFLGCLGLTVLTLLIGPEIKGAQRWLEFFGLTLQPSEFLKPGFIVFTAWMYALQHQNPDFPGQKIAVGALILVVALLAMQPDYGQAVLVLAVWLGQFFMAGLGWIWVGIFGLGALGLLASGYLMFPHVQSRIDRFLNPEIGDSYQIDTAINAFRHGGLLGEGLGEGTVKRHLPDAHSDFIFAVMGEEFGMIACLLLLGVFAFVVFRSLLHLFDESDHFAFLAVGGLTSLFGLQAIINMGVNLDMLPAKGMTLPFISYGGSSLLAMAVALGMVLALTRRQTGTPKRRSVWL